MNNVKSLFTSCALAGALVLAGAPRAFGGGLVELPLQGPFPWGDRDIYVVESVPDADDTVVVTGAVTVASSAALDTAATDTTARLAFLGGVPQLYTPSAGWTALSGGTALSDGASVAYRLVFETATDRVSATVGDWSVGWTAFGGGDVVLGYTERASVGSAIFAGSHIPAEDDPAKPATAWTLTAGSGFVTLTETVASGTAWQFKLTTEGVLSVTAVGTSTGLNFRTLPSGAPAVTALADGFMSGNAAIESVYLPASVTAIGASAFANCTALRYCAVPEDSLLATVGASAFGGCAALLEFRFTENLASLGTAGRTEAAFDGCAKMEIVGQTLPNSLTTFRGAALAACPSAVTGRMKLGGDNASDLAVTDGAELFRDMTGITEVAFGKGVTGLEASNAFSGCDGITNIICRRAAGFDFGTGFATLANLVQVDLYGWPTGTVPANGYALRVLAPCDDATWQALVASGTSTFTPWDSLSDAAKATYWSHFPTNGTDEVFVPEGRIAGTGGTKTYAGATFGYGTWVVYDKGFQSLTVKGSAGNLPPVAGEVAFSPAYGTTAHIVQTLGETFDCTAPRTVDDGLAVYDVSGYALRTKDEDGAFTVVVREGTFSGDEARTFRFDTAELAEDAYELTWVMTKTGYMEPQTVWTWDAGTGVLAESVASGTPWTFKLTAEGALSVATRGDARGLSLRTLPAEAGAIVSLAPKFLTGCATLEAIYLPASLETIGHSAFKECTNLGLVDIPEDSALATLGTAGYGDAAFESNPVMTLSGPTLPAGATNLHGAVIAECPRAVTGTLTLAGDDAGDLVCDGQDMFEEMTALGEVVFGAGVTGLAAPNAFAGCTGLTNIVCRNPAGFDFGDNFAHLPGLRQYDLYGWPTGTLVTNGTNARILAPCDDVTWLKLVYGGEGAFVPWDDLTEEEQSVYGQNFPGEVLTPEGRIAGDAGVQTFAGATFGAGTWVVFDKGDTPEQHSLTVKGSAGNFPGDTGEPAFTPGYGFTYSVVLSCGEVFDCTAPRFVVDGDTTLQITGYTLLGRDDDGAFTRVIQEGTFRSAEARSFAFDTTAWTDEAYELTWKMEEIGKTPPDTQWTWTSKGTYGYLTEVVTDGRTPWKFILKSNGLISVATKVDATSSTKINLRNLPANCPYAITRTGCYQSNSDYGNFMNNGQGGTASKAWSKAAGSIIEEIYLPDTVTTLGEWSFANCTNLVVCDFTPNSQLNTIGYAAIWKCYRLRDLRLTECMRVIDGKNNTASGIQSCSHLRILGPTLPDNLTTLGYMAFYDCPNAIRGTLVLGGSDASDLVLTDTPHYMFENGTNISEVVFGAAVTGFPTSYTSFRNCTGITNIVCRNPNGFNFATSFDSSMKNVRQYDFYGWPTGTLRTRNAATRILAPVGNPTWESLTNSAVFTAWENLDEDQQAVYWTNFPTNGTDEAVVPAGCITGTSGSKTFEGLTVGCGVWILFDKTQTTTTSLTVKGDPGNYGPAADQVAFSPAYGYTYDVKTSIGTAFACVAPRYAASGAQFYEVTNCTVRAKDTNGVFSVVVAGENFAGDEVRTFAFDTSVLTNAAYELTWAMGEVQPGAADTWSWDATAGQLTQSDAIGAAWVFALSDAGELSVVTRGVSTVVRLRDLPSGAPAITSLADGFLSGCTTITSITLPASLEAIGASAFSGCTALAVCDLPTDSALASVGGLAFDGCTALAHFRFTESLTSLGTAGSANGVFVNCPELAIDGPTLPESVTSLSGAVFTGCPNAVAGRLSIGGGDDHDVAIANGTSAFKGLTNVTEVLFGADVTGFGGSAAFDGCTALTNVICRNKDGFAFGKSFATPAALAQYDLYGWPTGTLPGNGYATRILASRNNANWQELAADTSLFLSWDAMTDEQRETYWTNFPSNDVVSPLVPEGCIAGTSGTKTFAGATFGYGTWVVYDKGEFPKALTVKGDPGDYAAESGETAFSPAYGTTEDIVTSYGHSFTCTAPRYAARGADRYEVTGYALRERDAAGQFTIETRKGSFSGTTPRTCAINTTTLTNSAYELTWTMTAAGLVDPDTAWSWDATERQITESVATGTPWVFALSEAGELSVVTRGTSAVLTFRTFSAVADGIKSLADGFLADCTTVELLHLPDSLVKIGARAFDGCTALRYCELTEDSRLAEIGALAFGDCTALASFRFTDRLTTLGTAGSADGVFVDCPALTIVGPTLPDGVTSLSGAVFSGCPKAIAGRLSIGGGDDHDVASADGVNAFKGLTGITEVVFGKGVTGFNGSQAFSGCTGITNIVCRNPDGFAFGTSFAALAPSELQCDLYGWPTGTLPANRYSLRILAPRDNATWRAMAGDGETLLLWDNMTAAQKNTYWGHWPDDGQTPAPVGRIAGASGTQTYADATFGFGTWIVFDKGEVVASKAMTVKGDPADYAADDGETAFQPGYGFMADVTLAYGTNFVCTAPRFAVEGGTTWQVTGYALREKDAAGQFTILTQEGTFSGVAAREFTFDAAVMTNDAYELTWKMEEIGANPPDTQWTFSGTTLTETGIAEGQTNWIFTLTSGGTLSVKQRGESTRLNLRNLPEAAYAIKALDASFMAGYTDIEEIYLPASLVTVGSSSFKSCTNLVVCDLPEDSQLAAINASAFNGCRNLRKLRFTERLKSLSAGANYGILTYCTKLRIVGPTMPNSLTTLKGQVFRESPIAICGRLTLGGGDATDISYLGSYSQYLFAGCTGITEVVFGKAVTKLVGTTTATFKGCPYVTNIVCRNPNGFSFAKSLSSDMKNVRQYDFYGWPTGTLVTKSTGTRLLVPSGNANWEGLVADETAFTAWDSLTDAQRETYWTNFPTNGVDEVLIPAGRIAGTSGTQTYEGLTVGYGVWVVFDKVQRTTTSLTVKGDPGNYGPAAGQRAFTPAYGFTYDVKDTFGTAFDCEAPRYTANGSQYYEITGCTLRTKDDDGAFTVVVAEETFEYEEERTFAFDTGVLTESAYELTWTMAEAEPGAADTWTWDATAGQLTQSGAVGEAWVFALSEAGELSVVTRGVSAEVSLWTLPDGAPAITALADGFLEGCTTVTSMYLPGSVEKIGARAFDGCTALAVCDLTESSVLASVGARAFASCTALERFRFTESLTSLGTAGCADGAFVDCPVLAIDGSMLPEAVTNLAGAVISGCPNAFAGCLTIGGADDHDVDCTACVGSFRDQAGLTEVVFGAGVTGFAATNAFAGCTALTNVVCRNAEGFDFGAGWASLDGLAQYDLYAWPTGTLVTVPFKARILAPRDNATWRKLVADETAFLPWEDLTETERDAYWTRFPSNDVAGALIPEGRIAGTSGTQDFEGATFGSGTWVVFDKGEYIVPVTLTVKGDPSDYAADSGETAFSPAYGLVEDVVADYGTNFVCTAPRIAVDGETNWQVTGYVLKTKDEAGQFTVVAQEGTFAGAEARSFTFDTAVLTAKAYELTWKMAELGANPPATQWTFSGTTLTETGVPDGQTNWIFTLTSAGKLTVKQTGESSVLNLRNLPEAAYAVKTLGGSFMKSCKTITEIYLPASVTTLDTYAFYGCSNLFVCDLPEDSQLATINGYVFNGCRQLRRLRFTERLKTLNSGGSNNGVITYCTRLRIDGPTLPNSLTTLRGQVFRESPIAICGRLTLGGGDDTDITYLGSTYSQHMFSGCTGITEVVFGAGVTKFYSPSSSTGFYGCTGITNIVCRNPDGFDFNTSFSSSLKNVKQYDLYGWPTGTLRMKNTGTRILAPRGNATWESLVTNETAFTAWTQLTEDQQATYWKNFPTNDVDEVLIPAGRIAGTSGTKTFEGLTVGYGVWVVFDKESQKGPTIPSAEGDITVDKASKTVTIVPAEGTNTVHISGAEGYTVFVPGTLDRLVGVTVDQVVVTNTVPAGYDISKAFKTVTVAGTEPVEIAIVLDEEAVVTIGEESIPVRPKAAAPAATEGGIVDGLVAAKAIPGLTYALVRRAEPGAESGTKVDEETPAETSLTLRDETAERPKDRAFYVIEVTK